jgi:D-amino-acid dehydrogenase
LEKSGIFVGFGHQHVGLTAGPVTGRLIAQLINGHVPNIDMTPYKPDRYTV